MAAVKTLNSSFLASTSNAAAATTYTATLDSSTGYGVSITCSIVNGATAPTIGCSAILQVSANSGTTYFNRATQTAGILASGTYYFTFDLPLGVGFLLRVAFVGNTGQAVTVAAISSITTAI